jgi:short-subunit dehydrogenase
MTNNILIVGGTSEIAIAVAKNLQESGSNIYSISRKKNNIKFYKDSLKINFDKKFVKKILLNNFFSKIKFSAVLFFNAVQVNNSNSFFNLSNKYLFKIVNVNCFFSVKLIYFLIFKKKLYKKCKIIFFSSRSGSIEERGKLKHHVTKGNHLYRASKSLLNSFIKNLSFQFKKEFIFAAYHPGWVKTKSSGGGKLSVKKASLNFLKFFNKFDKKSNGKFLDYKFKVIPW